MEEVEKLGEKTTEDMIRELCRELARLPEETRKDTTLMLLGVVIGQQLQPESLKQPA